MTASADGAEDKMSGAIARIEKGMASIEKRLDGLQREIARLQKLVGPFGVYMGDDVVLTQMLTGLRFLVPASDTVMAPKMIGNRVWEPSLSAVMPRLLRAGRDVVDVGANIGYFAVNAAMLLGRGGGAVVHAIEPNPRIHALLLKNISINWSLARIIPHQFALGETEGEMLLHVAGKLASNGSLLGPGAGVAGTETFPVAVKPLAQVIRDPGRIGLLKIDVEGAEAMVMRGAAEVLRAVPDIEIIMEWDTEAQRDDPGATAFLAQFFAEMGFSAFVVENGLAPTPVVDLPRLGYCNLFLTRLPGRPPS
ncbi:FkbM family methyltransferase [Roseomonas eburnea]|uniref:FkbM family methyltransferase n=1 Tax=Neoroseomonas eburnea TaxID=1346889 RepID=A0A9X9XC75_9PROT|nr:FkbM family methyltransferase [Neoroseomonas eburnea]MBR0681311.1 FkbM family methyltransferase [Neoroseomonas eburnea]